MNIEKQVKELCKLIVEKKNQDLIKIETITVVKIYATAEKNLKPKALKPNILYPSIINQ